VNVEADYNSEHLVRLFDDMAKTYGAVNLVSSFGLSHLWRKACIDLLETKPSHACADLMCGMGEATRLLVKTAGPSLSVHAVDFCPRMTERCRETVMRLRVTNVTVCTQDVFSISETTTFDRIACSFGLKTLNDSQLKTFAHLIKKLLKPSGRAAFVEIHIPANLLLRLPYLFYIRYVIPFIGWICLGNPSCYRYLARYTEDFASRDSFDAYLKEEGLDVSVFELFFGCARIYLARCL